MEIFLSIDEDMTPSVWWGSDSGCGAIALDKFFEESKVDMSKEMAAIYAEKFTAFAAELKDYSET